MPMEAVYYFRMEKSSWFISNMLAWGKEDYLSRLSISGLWDFLVKTPQKRILIGVLSQKWQNPILEKEQLIHDVESLLATEGAMWRGYNHTSLNKYGDIVSGDEVTDMLLEEYAQGITYFNAYKNSELSKSFVNLYKKINKLVVQRNGRLIITWPVTVKNKLFDLSIDEHKKNLDEFRKKLAGYSISIECEPELFNYDVNYFFNTNYHLNKNGTKIRSENLAQCIMKVLEERAL